MIDDRDRKILDLLQRDAGQPVQDIAEQVHLSASACSRRIARLKDEGYIARTVAVLDRRKLNLTTTVYCLIKTAHHSADWLERFRAAVADISEIVEAQRLAGNLDYILKIVVSDVAHYDTIYKRRRCLVASDPQMDGLPPGTAVDVAARWRARRRSRLRLQPRPLKPRLKSSSRSRARAKKAAP
ncbi:MAG: Lrp/AsnC family transcriptional regulator [Asticcacaulis sp.]